MYFDQINVLYGAIADNCTLDSCPTMTTPISNNIYWIDDKGKKFKYSASQYIDTVLTFISKTVNDESLFPTKIGIQFPMNFESLVKKIFKFLFNILAHMYHLHYNELLELKLNTFINSIYLHFFMFNKKFNILDDKDFETMDSLNKILLNKYFINLNILPKQQIQASPTTSTLSGFSFLKKKFNFNIMT
jgi:hypothetical protein